MTSTIEKQKILIARNPYDSKEDTLTRSYKYTLVLGCAKACKNKPSRHRILDTVFYQAVCEHM